MTLYTPDTIVALSTPSGRGAIGVIRLSGVNAIAAVNKVFCGKDLMQQATHTLHFGKIQDGETEIDEVVVGIFRAPHSYTKENVVEISCHGSPYIVHKLMTLFLTNGIRLANAGEFTQRAYLNGRFDLSQAEAVADLIASDSQAAHSIAMRQMRGGISNKLKGLRSALIEFTALLELELDFGEEDVEFADRNMFLTLLENIQLEIQTLSSSFKLGNAIKNGIPVAIVGKPNAGKSTLLNALLEEERAIVSSIAGTTRDTIEEILTIDGYLFRFIDTAGLRDTVDEIEKIGIERSNAAIEKADIIIYLYDLELEDAKEHIHHILQNAGSGKHVIVVGNKADKFSEAELERKVGAPIEAIVPISAKNKVGIDTLKSKLVNYVASQNKNENAVLLTNQRHYEALLNAGNAIDDVMAKMQANIPSDLLTQDIKIALRHIGEITGDIDIDIDILGTIFGKFCIGK